MPTVTRLYEIGQSVYTTTPDGKIFSGVIESYTVKVFLDSSGNQQQGISYEIYDSVMDCRLVAKEQKIILTYTEALAVLAGTINTPYC